MKRIFSLFLLLAMCLSVVACGQDPGSQAEQDRAKTPAGVIGKDMKGEVCIKEKNAGKIIEKVELTADNWQDYLEVFSYEQITIERDAFGEVISEDTRVVYLLGPKTQRYHTFSDDTAIEFYHKAIGERIVYEIAYDGARVDEGFHLDDYEFSRIIGAIYFLDIPEEVIVRTQWGDDHGEATFKIGDTSLVQTFYISTPTNAVRAWGNTFEKYMN